MRIDPDTEALATGSLQSSLSLDEIENLIDRGMYLQVHPHIEALIAYGEARAALLAVRSLRFLGADRAGDALALRTGRRHPQDAAAITALIRIRIARLGPYSGYLAFQRYPLPVGCPDALRAEYLSLQAFLMCLLRDFDECQRISAEARSLDPANPWLWVEWSYCCERADRYEEALLVAEHALGLFPGFRAARQQRASLLVLLRRTDEAITQLREDIANSECVGFAMQLYDLLYERAEYAECAIVLNQIEQWMPRADKWARSGTAARRSDIAMATGDMVSARSQAEQVCSSVFYRNVAERIAQGHTPRRVMLPVGFVRQHWNTCAPATLAALAEYWNVPADHLEIADEICYDGTTDSSERCWATDNGFITREFRVDWETACALLDAGIPFTLATVYTGGGHLQAVIGYDALRGSLLIRDPFQPTHAEFDAQALFEQHQSSGPRGMVMVPQAEAAKLAGIALPDADPWDDYHALVRSLVDHDRDAALAALARLQAKDPAHRLCRQGARTLAMYDGDEPEILRHTEALLAQFPDDVNLQLSKAASLWAIGGRAAHLEWLGQLANRRGADQQILLRYADRLAEDGRRLPQALAITRRALRMAGGNGRGWSHWAVLTWQSGATRASLPIYRYACTLIDTDEDYAATYFRACHYLRETETGLKFLRARAERLGRKAPAALITLFEQLDNLERVDEAFAVLDQALALHPQDAALAAYCAEAHLRYGRLERADALLAAISAPLRRASWLRAQSLLCDARNDFGMAIQHAREACKLEPLNLRHHRSLAAQLSRHEGRAAAVAWLRDACERHPRHYGLHRLCYDWLPDEAVAIEQQLRRMLEAHPGDAWVLRELATQLTRNKRYDEAQPFARAALVREPQHADSHGTLAYLKLRRDGYAAGAPHLREAVRLNIDYDYALRTLIQDAPDAAQAQAAIDFVRTELVRQVTTGDSLLTFQEAAQSCLDAESLLGVMREAHAARPDLWHAWVALGIQLTDMGRAEEALSVFDAARERYSMLPRLYVEHAHALKLLGRREAAREKLEAALAISPTWNRAVRLFVDTVTEEGRDWVRAIRVVRHALTRDPENADLRGLLGWLLEQACDYPAAFEAVTASLKLDPKPRWVWSCAYRLCEARERMGDFDALVEDVERSRPGDPWAWVARAQQGRDDAAALAAAERALQLEPHLFAAWEARLDRLIRLKRSAEVAPLLAALQWPYGEVPADLLLWGARALREQDARAAKAQLRELLVRQPNEYACWRQLADWEDDDGDNAAYLDAARELLRIAPNAAMSHAYLGHALVKSEQDNAAVPCLLRALEIEPDYVFASRQLVATAMRAGRPDAALQGAEMAWPHHQRTDIAMQATRAACQMGQRERAEEWLRRTVHIAGYDDESAGSAIKAVREAGWADAVPQVVEQCLREGQCAWRAALEWTADQVRKQRLNALLDELDPVICSDKGHLLCMALADHAAEEKHRKLFDALLKRYRERLHAHDGCWGEVSYGFVRFGEHESAVAWTNDWRSRAEAPLWALNNLTLAHASLGQFKALDEVVHAVLKRQPDDDLARFWQLVAHATADRVDALGEALARSGEWRISEWMDPLVTAIRAYHRAIDEGRFMSAIRPFSRLNAAADHGRFVKLIARRLSSHLCWRHAPRWQAPILWVLMGGW